MPLDISNYYGETPLITQGPDISGGTQGNLDTVTYQILTGPDYLDDLATLGFVKGQPVPDTAFHAVALEYITILRESDRLRLLSLTCTGIVASLASDPASNSFREFDPSPGSETFTAGIVGYPMTRRTYQPTLTHTYYTTTEPDTAAIGQVVVVANPPACPAARVIYRAVIPDPDNAGQYLSYGEVPVVSNITPYENQWVLENRIPEVIYQTESRSLWRVTDILILSTLVIQDVSFTGSGG